MGIGAVSFQPYIYSTNAVSRNSMNKISAIGKDLTQRKTNFDGLVEEEAKAQNENPLRVGETADFDAIVDEQMQTSRRNASRFFEEMA